MKVTKSNYILTLTFIIYICIYCAKLNIYNCTDCEFRYVLPDALHKLSYCPVI